MFGLGARGSSEVGVVEKLPQAKMMFKLSRWRSDDFAKRAL